MPFTRKLALAQLANSIGDGGYYVCSALYFTLVVGLSAAQVGLGLTVGWGLGSVAGVLAGHLADRWGPRRVAVLLAGATAASIGTLVFVRSFAFFVPVAAVYASCQCGLAAARQALLAGLVDGESRTRARAHLQSATNAGLAVGAAFGGLALSVGTREAYLAIFVLDALSFIAAGALLRRLPDVPPIPARRGEPAFTVLRDRPFAVLTALNTIMMLYLPLLSLVIPLWIVRRTAAPPWMVSVLLVVNTLGVVLFQVRTAGRVHGLLAAGRFVRYSGIVLLAACGVFAFSGAGSSAWTAAATLLAAAGLQVFGELMLAAGSWRIGFDLAPAGRQGQYQGFYAGSIALARMLGPALLTTLIVTGGVVGWLVLGGAFLLAGCATAPAVRWAEARASAASPVKVGQ